MSRTIIQLPFVLITLVLTPVAAADIVTFSGSGPYSGSFRSGSVTADGTGDTAAVSVGTVAPSPNSNLFAFNADQILSVTDVGDSGAAAEFLFSGETFNAGDHLYITSIGTESSILLEASIGGSQVDANWSLTEILGPQPAFDDDASGVNATIDGAGGAPAGLLLTSSVSGIDQLRISWIGDGSGNQGLQFGLVAVPEPTTSWLLVVGLGFLQTTRRRRMAR